MNTSKGMPKIGITRKNKSFSKKRRGMEKASRKINYKHNQRSRKFAKTSNKNKRGIK